MRRWLFLVALICLCPPSFSQVPETGRWQELSFSAAEVHHQTADKYREILATLATARTLDDDAEIAERVTAIMQAIVKAAADMQPGTATWQWEVHTSSDPNIDAFCLAGGKLLVSSHFIRQLNLTDGELATLIAHEVAHAVAEHQREELSEARYIKPQPASSLEIIMSRLDSDLSLQLCLSKLSSVQESEADQLGIILAHRAGWPTAEIVSFYQKLLVTEEPSVFSSSHPSGTARLSMAKGMALLLAP